MDDHDLATAWDDAIFALEAAGEHDIASTLRAVPADADYETKALAAALAGDTCWSSTFHMGRKFRDKSDKIAAAKANEPATDWVNPEHARRLVSLTAIQPDEAKEKTDQMRLWTTASQKAIYAAHTARTVAEGKAVVN